MAAIRRFAAELKRRKVYHVALVYVVVAFAIWEAADIAFPALGLPAVAVTFMLVVTALGLPLALVLAWAYELRPEEAAPSEEAAATGPTDTATQPPALTERPAAAPRADDAGPARSAHAVPADPLARDRDRSIAVLPFANMSDVPESDYFADGIAEELINALAQVRGLRVVARTSAFGFRDSTADIREIARSLDVSYVVEGSVRRAGGRIRVTAQLIDAGDGYHLWSERYQRPEGDVFEIQDGIVEAVTRSLLSRLPTTAEERGPRTDDPLALDTYLQARAAHVELSPGGLARARALYEAVVERDPDFALAHAALADVGILQATGFGTEPPTEIMPRARAAAERALALSPDLPEGHLARGLVLLFHDREYDAARRELERALELSPSSFDAHFWMEFHHTYVRRDYDAAIRSQRRAAELSPLDPRPRIRIGWIEEIRGRHDEAAVIFRELYDEGVARLPSGLGLASSLIASGQVEEGVEWARKILEDPPVSNNALGMVGAMLGSAGHTPEGRACLRELEERSASGAAVHFWSAVALGGLGRLDEAFERLDLAVAERDPSLLYLSVVPPETGLPGDPRFARTLERIGLGHLAPRPSMAGPGGS